MTPGSSYSLADVLVVAKAHPFYSDAQHPPDEETIQRLREQAALSPTSPDLKGQPLIRKKDLYTTIERLVDDTSPQNTYRHNVYISITGGGSGGKPLFFATDASENRRHRAYFSQFVRNAGLIERGDWALSTHWGGNLYRSLDLTTEIFENAGASILSGGNHIAPSKTIKLLQDFHVNVLTGDGSQVVQVVHHISKLPPVEKEKIKINKIIYTSEALTAGQKAHIYEVLGSVKLCSIIGSSEAGPYGLNSPDLIPIDPSANHTDFIIDTRMMFLEIFPLSSAEDDDIPTPLPEGQTGAIVQTSLTRLRNPLVRYISGDIGSLHPLPDQARAVIPETEWQYMRLLRVEGRDTRFDFPWDGAYWEFGRLSAAMADPKLGVLQWQIILDKMGLSSEVMLDLRILCSQSSKQPSSRQAVVDLLKGFFCIDSANQHRFRPIFVDNLSGFEVSETGRKVIKFLDRST